MWRYPGLYILLGLVAFVLIAGAWVVYERIRAGVRTEIEAEAGRQALVRIRKLENNNANFKALDDRGRCLVFMRDSGLPLDACD